MRKLRRSVRKFPFAHELVYDDQYYRKEVEGYATGSAGTIAASVVRDLKPRLVVDVGCGTGALCKALRERGCEVLGLEYSSAALAQCRSLGLDVRRFDIENDEFNDVCNFDATVSMEVAEHLPERTANRYADLLTRLSDTIVFTAAPPGQGGTDHVNEQPPSYWIGKFRDRGFLLDEALSESWRREWTVSGAVAFFYRDNLMVFRRAQNPASP